MGRYTCPKCGHKGISDYTVSSLAYYSDGISRIQCPKCGIFDKITLFNTPGHSKANKMIVIKTNMLELPEYCDDCDYYQCFPHPRKGWTNVCGLCYESMDDDAKDGGHYDGDTRPKNCPLIEIVD